MQNILQQALLSRRACGWLLLFGFGWVATTFLNGWGKTAAAQQPPAVVTISAASFAAAPVAPEAIVSAFGAKLATGTASATVVPLPKTLAGTTVKVNGEDAPLFFVSPQQINFQIPAGTPSGTASLVVRASDGTTTTGTVDIVPVAPALFTANANGQGALAALLLRAKGSLQTTEPLAQLDPDTRRFVVRPFAFGDDSEQLFLILFLSGLRNAAPGNVRVVLGGVEFAPQFVGPVAGLAGLEQINLPLPRTFGARGSVTLFVKVAGAAASNAGLFAISGDTNANASAPLQIASLSSNPLLAGDEVTLTGAGFAANPRENQAQIVSDDGVTANADVLEVSGTTLRIRVPFGAGKGRVRVTRGQVEASLPVNVRTSVSGFVERFDKDQNKRVGIPNARVRLRNQPQREVTTSADGSFVLADLAVSQQEEFEILPPANGVLNFPTKPFYLRVLGNRDNQLPRGDEQTLVTGVTLPLADEAAVAQAESINPDQTPIVTFLASGRTPANLPIGHFSNSIAQVTPFGVTFTPGRKLTFPNSDGLQVGTQARLFKFDQTAGSATRGQFIDIGAATVTANGVETAAQAITEGSFYFASIPRPTTTLFGRVVESTGRPVSRAIVQTRGQSTFTDSFGGFVLRDVPVLAPGGDQTRVEVSFMRPDASIARKDRLNVPLTPNSLIEVAPEIVLDAVTANRAPILLVPASLTVEAGKTSDFNFSATDLDIGQTLQVSVGGASFANITQSNCTNCTLRLTPGAAVTGDFTLSLRAQDNVGAATSQTIALRVNAPKALTAYDQAVVTDEDTAKVITLTGNTANASFVIVTSPANGSLSGTGASRTYMPTANFNGVDSFTFKTVVGTSESNVATAFIVINPVNDAPVLNVPGAQMVNAGQELSFIVTATDVDLGQGLTCTATGLPPGATFVQQSVTSWKFSWTPVFNLAGAYEPAFALSDGGLNSTQRVTLIAQAPWARTSGPGGATTLALLTVGNRVFAGTQDGGVFVSANQGNGWAPANEGLPVRSVGVLRIREVARALAALGQKVFVIYGSALYATTNDGQSWQLSNNGLPNCYSILAVGQTLFAGTYYEGVYRSTDQGRSWVKTGSVAPLNAESQHPLVYALAANGTALYASLLPQQPEGLPQRVYCSTDNGQNWQPRSTGLPDNIEVYTLAALNGALFAGTSRSLFRSTDQGATWTAANQGLPVNTILALASRNGRLFCGTSGGLFYSDTNGQSWLLSDNGLPSAFRQITAFANTESYLLTGVFVPGVFRTDSQGQTWAAANSGLSNTYITEVQTRGEYWFARMRENTIAFSANQGQSWTLRANNGMPRFLCERELNLNPFVLISCTFQVGPFAAVGTQLYAGGNFSSGAYYSADLGENWTRLIADDVFISQIAAHDTAAFAVQPLNQEQSNILRLSPNGAVMAGVFRDGQVYTLVGDGMTLAIGGNRGVYVSPDQGLTWQDTRLGGDVQLLALSGTNLYAVVGNKFFYSADLGRNWMSGNGGAPLDFFANSMVAEGRTVYLRGGGGVYVSRDQGRTWTLLDRSLGEAQTSVLAVGPQALILGTRSTGVYALVNRAESWLERNAGLGSRAVNTVMATDAYQFAGTLSSGVSRSTNQGQSWSSVNTGLPANANIQALHSFNDNLFTATFGNGVYRSANNGDMWTSAGSGLTNNYITALASRGSKLFAAATTDPQTNNPGGIFVSTNNGAVWTASNTGLTNRKVNTLVALETQLFAGTEGGGVFVSEDDGATWQARNVGLSGGALFARAFVAQGNAIFIGTDGGGIYRSTDGGASWTAVNNQLPPTLNVYAFAVNGKRLYAGSIYGVFVSDDQGASWKQINAGLLDVFVTGLAVSGDKLVAGTLRGGVFLSTIPQ